MNTPNAFVSTQSRGGHIIYINTCHIGQIFQVSTLSNARLIHIPINKLQLLAFTKQNIAIYLSVPACKMNWLLKLCNRFYFPAVSYSAVIPQEPSHLYSTAAQGQKYHSQLLFVPWQPINFIQELFLSLQLDTKVTLCWVEDSDTWRFQTYISKAFTDSQLWFVDRNYHLFHSELQIFLTLHEFKPAVLFPLFNVHVAAANPGLMI